MLVFDSVTVKQMAQSGSAKWTAFPNESDYPEAIGMWLAEMDLGIAPELRDLVVEKAERGQLGYVSSSCSQAAIEATASWLGGFGFDVAPERITLLPDVLTGLRHVLDHFTSPGSPVIVPTPAYMPFLTLPAEHGRDVVEVPSILDEDGLWRLDYDGIERAFAATGAELLVLCNPWNPTGRCLARDELLRLSRIVQTARARVFEDAIHLPLVLEGAEPCLYAPLNEATSRHTIVSIAASKGWNVPGLKCAQLVFSNDEDAAAFAPRRRLASGAAATMGVQAAALCYRKAGEWNRAVRQYLSANRDILEERVAGWDGVRIGHVEGTYIAFLDFRALDLDGTTPAKFLARKAGVVLTEGASCGKGFEGWARIVFATSRSILTEALDRIEKALYGKASS